MAEPEAVLPYEKRMRERTRFIRMTTVFMALLALTLTLGSCSPKKPPETAVPICVLVRCGGLNPRMTTCLAPVVAVYSDRSLFKVKNRYSDTLMYLRGYMRGDRFAQLKSVLARMLRDSMSEQAYVATQGVVDGCTDALFLSDGHKIGFRWVVEFRESTDTTLRDICAIERLLMDSMAMLHPTRWTPDSAEWRLYWLHSRGDSTEPPLPPPTDSFLHDGHPGFYDYYIPYSLSDTASPYYSAERFERRRMGDRWFHVAGYRYMFPADRDFREIWNRFNAWWAKHPEFLQMEPPKVGIPKPIFWEQ